VSAATVAPDQRARLSDDQLQELMKLIQGSDSVELKVTVDNAEQRRAIDALDMDPLNAQIRQVLFFDTPDLALSQAGVVARSRRVQNKGDDSTIKLRPITPDDIAPELRSQPGFVVEVDTMPGAYVCSASLTAALKAGDTREVMKGERPIRKLFSKAQRAFYEAHAPAGLALDDLSILGPIFVLKLKWAPERFARPLVAEMWLYPDSTVMLELSTKTFPSQAFQVAAETRAFLASHGISATGGQDTKTRHALQVFSKRLAESTA
jgi:hypothetical protein